MGRSHGRGPKGSAPRGRLNVEVVGRAAGLTTWLEAVAPARARGTMSVAIVSDARVRALNRQYRKKDTATDVLSFPAFAPSALRRGKPPAFAPSALRRGKPPGDGEFLGDVVIASGVAARQAREAGHSLATELRVLALHGLLHLLGYDHERDDGRMARLERRLRRRGGLREGLIERG
jgi:probable rRNA maturation factor